MVRDTSERLPGCWEIKGCGRTPGGCAQKELGTCPAYPDNGHSCWAVAGTFCGGRPQGEYAAKIASCIVCDVFSRYNPATGSLAGHVQKQFPEEFATAAAVLRRGVVGR